MTMELGGKNPVVVAPSADMALATRLIAATRMLNSGQICPCSDYVFVPRKELETFVQGIVREWKQFYPTYLANDAVVSIVNGSTRLKVDRSFVRNVITDPGDAAVVNAILYLGQSFGLQVIAEGVETEAQLSWVAERGCAEAQGYLFGRPVPAATFLAEHIIDRGS